MAMLLAEWFVPSILPTILQAQIPQPAWNVHGPGSLLIQNNSIAHQVITDEKPAQKPGFASCRVSRTVTFE